jgi:signal peptidase I
MKMTFTKVKKWVSKIVSILLVLLLVFMIFLVVSTKIGGGEPQVFGYQFKTVLSGSMEPGIKTGSIIAVKLGGDMTKFKKNDVITFKADEKKLVTHRIIKVTKNGDEVLYRTKGDNNKTEDLDPVMSQNVVAEYKGFTIPYLGYFVDFTKSKMGIALLLIIPGLLFIAYSAFSLWKTIAQIDKKIPSQNVDETI